MMCARCRKRVAVVFLTKLENGESKQEGLCLKCAKELGIKPIDDIIAQTGLDDETIEQLNGEMDEFMETAMAEVENGDESQTRTPFLNFAKLMNEGSQNKPNPANPAKKKKGEEKDGGKDGRKELKFLTQYTTDLTEKARRGEVDRVIGRDRELARVVQILCRRQKNNPCLIGEPGVGKTAIAEALALRVADGNVPYRLKNTSIHLVDLTALVAGTQFRGQFESRVLGLLNDVKAKGNVILVIDEVHNLVGVGDAEGSMNAANILKPALSRGEIQVIGATTLNEYRKYIEKDSALERRFQPVTVNEPSIADTVEILKGIKSYYEAFHGVKIPEAILESAASLSERYITDRYLPDKAIDLLDEAASHISVHSAALAERHMLADRKLAVETERNELEAKGTDSAADEKAMEEHYRHLADLKAEELRIAGRLAELDAECEAIRMTEADLADVIEIWTGVPASTITESEYTRLAELEARLSKRIIGQDEAVSAVSRAVRRNRAGVSYKKKPVSFIFAGPTGVGKTELVKVLSEDLFSTPDALIRIDMSEFMEKYSVSRLTGSAPGYVGYDEAGQLTEKIRRRPYSVVLFDEIEKAHPDVMNILLQILDDGIITDSHGRQVDFSNTVIVMTTNAGSTHATAAPGFMTDVQVQNKDKTNKALSEFLRPEFINRVDEIITFRQLEQEDFQKIARIMLGDLEKVLEKKGISIVFGDDAVEYVARKSYSVKYGARNMRRFIQTELEDKIAGEIIDRKGNVRAVSVSAKDTAADGEGLVVTVI
ncbi:MAG: ATP-dependent Clp protease ATP-binding subunit [Clostridia bacterium]|nr:ATP-dependent Clp protease ATP-binding subunit [Clostridia bacterium]